MNGPASACETSRKSSSPNSVEAKLRRREAGKGAVEIIIQIPAVAGARSGHSADGTKPARLRGSAVGLNNKSLTGRPASSCQTFVGQGGQVYGLFTGFIGLLPTSLW